MHDGTPMPTRYWLVGEPERTLVSRLEAAGGVNQAEAEIDPAVLADAHDRYAAEREAAIPAGHEGHRPSGGVGGTRLGVKCLHAHSDRKSTRLHSSHKCASSMPSSD